MNGERKCQLCPAGKECVTPWDTPVDCDDGFYSLEGSVNCYPIPPNMEANTLGAKTMKPTHCPAGHVSGLANTAGCEICDATYGCYGNDIAQELCTSENKMNSRAGEMSCFPYKFTYPQNWADPTSTTITDNMIAIEIQQGNYNFDGNAYDIQYDCPPGH